MSVPRRPQRKSVPTASVESWWAVGWAYVMPDFDRPNYSIVEWLSNAPVKFPAAHDREADELAVAVANLSDEYARAG